jgi:hypothetical protein
LRHARPDNLLRPRPPGFGGSTAGMKRGTGNTGRKRWERVHFPIPYGYKRCRTCGGRSFISDLRRVEYHKTGQVILEIARECYACNGTGMQKIRPHGKPGVPHARLSTRQYVPLYPELDAAEAERLREQP